MIELLLAWLALSVFALLATGAMIWHDGIPLMPEQYGERDEP